MATFKQFGDSLITHPRLMSSNSCFYEVMADVLTSWHDVDRDPSAPEHHTAKCSAFIDALFTLLMIVEVEQVYLFIYFHCLGEK